LILLLQVVALFPSFSRIELEFFRGDADELANRLKKELCLLPSGRN
jgi:hypothetical protein